MAFDIKKLSNREKTMIGLLVVVFSTFPFFYLTVPTWNSYMDSSNKILQDRGKLNDLDVRIRRLEKLKDENIKLSKKLENQKLYLAKSYEIDFLVQDLKKICDESSISLESFTPSTPEPVNIVLEKQIEEETKGRSSKSTRLKQAFAKLKGQDLPIDLYRFPIEVKVTGNFTDIIELFKKLEKYGRVISVDNISIGKVQAKESFGDRLSKTKLKKQESETGTLFGTFDLIAYTSAKDEETIPFSALEKTTKTTFKYKRKRG